MSKAFIRNVLLSKPLIAILLVAVVCGGIALAQTMNRQPPRDRPGVTKNVSFAILEDYDKGDDLSDVAKDFALMNELEIDTLRCSFGWDDYEPVQGQYDFAWLEDFVSLAAQYGIKVRPYIAYTAEWAGTRGEDEIYWNNPPAMYRDWWNFVGHLAQTLSDHPNVLSYEIYNEENLPLWWDGNLEQYKETLKEAAWAVRANDPDAQILLGGLTSPDDNWLHGLTKDGYAQYYDIVPFHAYPETWSDPEVVVENYLGDGGYRLFVLENDEHGGGKPIWINEMGYATAPGRSETDQANWWARAVSTFLAEPEVEHIGIYEIKDLNRQSAAIGDAMNYHLGITYTNRDKKLAFYTVDMLTDLLDTGTLTTADAEAKVTFRHGNAGQLYYHLFRRPDDAQVLFVWDKSGHPTVDITLKVPGASAERFSLKGEASPYKEFDGSTLSNVTLTPGNVEIFRINP